jgi:hypothetical protein
MSPPFCSRHPSGEVKAHCSGETGERLAKVMELLQRSKLYGKPPNFFFDGKWEKADDCRPFCEFFGCPTIWRSRFLSIRPWEVGGP